MQIIYNDILLNDLGLKLKTTNHTNLPSKSYESIKIPGRTGNLIIDDESYNNKTIELVFLWDLRGLDIRSNINQLRDILQAHRGYKDLIFGDGYIFNAICSNEIVFNEIVENYYEVNIVFEAFEKVEVL